MQYPQKELIVYEVYSKYKTTIFMAGGVAPSSSNSNSSFDPNKNYTAPLAVLTALFFMWGFITCLNDILIPALKEAFHLNNVQSMLINTCFFGAFFIMAIPSGKIIEKIGYKKGIIIGLITMLVGCALFYPAAELKIYGIFLGALFILASGITVLQVAANPYYFPSSRRTCNSQRRRITLFRLSRNIRYLSFLDIISFSS